jgi:hypothetical protein
VTAAATTFELGLNYWPKRRAMYMWRDFALTQDFLPRPLCVSPPVGEWF